jgi:beta-lysine 5,6-aminomutase beta subunit
VAEAAQPVRVRPYADHLDDGIIKVSLTVPLAHGPAARRAALEIAATMGLERAEVTHAQQLTDGFTYLVLYGRFPGAVEVVSAELEPAARLTEDEVEDYLARRIGRPVVVVGASTGTDAHSVGIDAMLNLKGYHGHRGLEGLRGFVTHNLGSQVPNAALLAKAVAVQADAILVSQTVTQQSLHIHNMTEFVDLVEAQRIRDRVILVCGGPSMSHELAKELGFDAGFGRGTLPCDLADYLVAELAARLGQRPADGSGGAPCG